MFSGRRPATDRRSTYSTHLFKKLYTYVLYRTDRTKYIHIQFALYYVLQVYNRCLNTECTVQWVKKEPAPQATKQLSAGSCPKKSSAPSGSSSATLQNRYFTFCTCLIAYILQYTVYCMCIMII